MASTPTRNGGNGLLPSLNNNNNNNGLNASPSSSLHPLSPAPAGSYAKAHNPVRSSFRPGGLGLGLAGAAKLKVRAHHLADAAKAAAGESGISGHKFREQIKAADFQAALKSQSSWGCSEIVRLMNEVMKHPDLYVGVNLLTTGMYSIFNLAIDDSNRASLGEAGACETVLQLMARHSSGYEKIALFGVAAIANLAYHCRPNQDRLGEGFDLGADGNTDAGTVIANAMERRPKHREIQIHGCAAARNLALNHPVNPVKLREAGVRKLITAASWAFPNDPGASGLAHWSAEALEVLPPEAEGSPLVTMLFAEMAAQVHSEHEEVEGMGAEGAKKEEEAERAAGNGASGTKKHSRRQREEEEAMRRGEED